MSLSNSKPRSLKRVNSGKTIKTLRMEMANSPTARTWYTCFAGYLIIERLASRTFESSNPSLKQGSFAIVTRASNGTRTNVIYREIEVKTYYGAAKDVAQRMPSLTLLHCFTKT